MSHQMTWYILAHMPYFRRPGHIFQSIAVAELGIKGSPEYLQV